MAFFLGIDGGGTKTRCVLADETTVVAKSMTGGCSVIRHGEQQAREALHSAIGQVCTTGKIPLERIGGICIGVTGAARPEIAGKIRGIVSEMVPGLSAAKIEVIGDNVIALEAAFGTGAGVITIAGTGSIVYGRDADGKTVRAGGWGFAVSDEGSGYWIGRRAISAILAARDRGGEAALEAMVLHAWKIKGIDELVQQANATPPPDFPRLFSIVLRAAEEGDDAARGLLTEAGMELARLTTIAVRRLVTAGMLPISTTGSVFRQSAEVRQVFYNTLRASFPGIEVRQDLADPVEGALARARRI
jgi:glucosamine kinase